MEKISSFDTIYRVGASKLHRPLDCPTFSSEQVNKATGSEHLDASVLEIARTLASRIPEESLIDLGNVNYETVAQKSETQPTVQCAMKTFEQASNMQAP